MFQTFNKKEIKKEEISRLGSSKNGEMSCNENACLQPYHQQHSIK